VDYTTAQQYLDHIFLMSYDFYGGWSNTDWATRRHCVRQHGVRTPTTPPKTAWMRCCAGAYSPKIVGGCGMYGRGWTGVHGYTGNNPFTGTATGMVKGTWEPAWLTIVRSLTSTKASLAGNTVTTLTLKRHTSSTNPPAT
jgi:chitinase